MVEAQVLIDAFSNAVSVALAEMAAVDAALIEAVAEPGPLALQGVCAALTLRTTSDGLLLLMMPEQTAQLLAGRILALVMPSPDASMVRDCIGELANIIAGQAKTLLYATPWHFNLSAPWAELPPIIELKHAFRVTFGSDAGNLALIVDFP